MNVREVFRWIALFVMGATVACDGNTRLTHRMPATGGTEAGAFTAVVPDGAVALDSGSSGSSHCGVVTGGHGDCGTPLGWGFDGTGCRLYSGCDCSPNCGSLFVTALDCARACRLEQHCNVAKLKGGGINLSFVEGSFCDSIAVCPGQAKGEDLTALLGLPAGCEADASCGTNQPCGYMYQDRVSSEDWDRLCTVSLLPVDSVACWILGP